MINIPLEQGLKQYQSNRWHTNRSYSYDQHSIRTRIETRNGNAPRAEIVEGYDQHSIRTRIETNIIGALISSGLGYDQHSIRTRIETKCIDVVLMKVCFSYDQHSIRTRIET